MQSTVIVKIKEKKTSQQILIAADQISKILISIKDILKWLEIVNWGKVVIATRVYSKNKIVLSQNC